MNRRQIKQRLDTKFNDFVASIKNDEIKKIVKEKSYITGGSIVSLLLNEEPNDYDIYFKDFDSMKKVSQYFLDIFNKHSDDKATFTKFEDTGRWKLYVPSKGIAKVREKGKIYEPVFVSANAMTLEGNIQLIVRFYGEPSEVHENYDFVHCTCYYEPSTAKLSLPERAIESILTKELVYTGSKYPLASMVRTRKFIKRGWNINAGQYIKMAFQLAEHDLTDPYVLDDQLTGVDTFIFASLIEEVKKEKDKNSNFVVTLDYISNVIDKEFTD